MITEPESLQSVFDARVCGIGQVREAFTPQLTPREVGTITSIATGIAKVSGLPAVGFEELVKFPGDVLGIAFNVDEAEIGVVLLGEYWHLNAGDEVERTGRVMDVVVGDGLLGRVIDPLGRPLDGNGPVAASERLPIERTAPHIMDRAPVTVPLQTGLKVIDALIPVGRGQRELILGDRQTGKTAIAIDTILNQRDQNVLCVYCAIGQRASAVAKAVATLREKGAMDYTVLVVTEGNDPPGLAFIAPYAATSIAEHFMEQGRDVLVVYDDLTHHARAYRELSLLLRRPPGREAFPGDIFYIHARLLERATHLRKELGGGSLTALPIIETEAQNISAYIPTNLISITDGQIYLSPSLFELGVLPAVDVGKSVSRVGGKAQRAAYRAVAGDLKLAYAQFEELETFARFGARLDENTRKIIEHGRRIRACLKQAECAPVSVPAQIAVLLALTAELFDRVALDQMTDAEHAVQKAAANIPAEVCARFESADKLSDEDRKTIIEIARQALTPFQPKPEAGAKPKPEPAAKPNPIQPASDPKPRQSLMAGPSRTLQRSPRRKPRRSHERHHGEPAPKDQQCRRSPIRRPHDESLGRIEHRTIREIGARVGRLLSDRGAGVGRVLSGKRAGGHDGGTESTNPMRVRSARSFSGPIRDWWVSSTTWWPITRSRPSRLCPAKRKSGRSASVFMRVWRMRACRWSDSSPCRTPSRPSPRSSGRFKLKAKRIGPKARMPAFGYSITDRCLERSTNRLASGCCRSMRNGNKVWPKSAGRPPTCPRSWAAAPRLCAHLSANIFSSRSSGPAPNPWRARTRAAWRRWSAPIKTSTTCWSSFTAPSTSCARVASTKNSST